MDGIAQIDHAESLRSVLEDVAQHGVPGLRSAEVLDVGSGPFLDYFSREILDGLVARGGATCRFFEGSYGAGKTHLLRLLQARGLCRGMAVCWIELTQALQLEDWDQIVRHILQTIEIEVDGQVIRTLPATLEALAPELDDDPLERFRASHVPHPGFKNAMLRVIAEARESRTPTSSTRGFLLGERVNVKALTTDGVRDVRDRLSKRNAEAALATVLTGLYHIGVPGVMLLFDENEKTLESSGKVSRRVKTAANLIRRLIDACTGGSLPATVVVFAVLPGFINRCSVAYDALGQRIRAPDWVDRPVPWRWPLLPLHAISETNNPEEFLDAICTRLEEIATEITGSAKGLRSELMRCGNHVLQTQAGSEYRRELVRRLCLITYQHVGGD